jgi:hypothetical protein
MAKVELRVHGNELGCRERIVLNYFVDIIYCSH